MSRKQIVVIAKHNQAEALRVAAGLTLLNDSVRVAVLGVLPDDPGVREQKEVLDFADVPCGEFAPTADAMARLAGVLAAADVVYLL